MRWLAADVATTTYPISGLGFQPKALRFSTSGLGNTVGTDQVSETQAMLRGVGFAISASSRRAVASFSGDATASGNCGAAVFDNCIAAAITGGGALDGLLDLSSIDADGFTLIVDDQLPSNRIVFWEAWGGTDISIAEVGDITEPAATGDQDYTVTGFVSGATDQVVFIAGSQSSSALNTVEDNDSGFCLGYATGSGAQNVVLVGNADDGAATMLTDGYARGDECLARIAIGGGNPVALASLTAFGTDNFRLNWTARAGTGKRSIFLAIKGGSWRAGDYIIDVTTGSNTATVSGLPFAPVGLLLMSRHSTEQSSGTADDNDVLSHGAGSSAANRHTFGFRDENAVDPSEVNLVTDYDQVLAVAGTAGDILAAFDISAMNSDGFQIIVDTADAGGSATTWHGYLAFGNAPAGGSVLPILMNQYRLRRA